MTHEEAFLRAVLDAPDDDAPRLAYADWLEERGDPRGAARAEFIRLQCRLAQPDALDDPDRWVLLAREEQLLREHGKGWAGPLRRLVKRWRFRRGFVEAVAVYAEGFLKHAERLFRVAPVRHVRLLGDPILVPGRRRNFRTGEPEAWALGQNLQRLLPELARCPHLSRLRGLDLSGQRFDLAAFEALLRSPRFPALEALSLNQTSVCTDEGFQLLARSPQFGSLTSLALSGGHHPREGDAGRRGISGEAMRELANSPHLGRVTRLHIGCSSGDLTNEALTALAHSRLLGQLTELATSSAHFDGGVWWRYPRQDRAQGNPLGVLLRSPEAARLRVLRLRRPLRFVLNLEALLGSPYLSNLRSLDLRNCVLDEEQTGALAGARHLGNLVELDLSCCFTGAYANRKVSSLDPRAYCIGDEPLRLLAAAPGLPRLASLRLDENLFSAAALRDFARGPLLGRLRWLSIQGPRKPIPRERHERLLHLHQDRRVGDAAAEAFASSDQTGRLVYLDLGNHRLTDDGLRALAASPHLGTLMALKLWSNDIGEPGLFTRADPLGSPGVSAVLVAPGLSRLATLDLRSNPLPPAARGALRDRFRYGARYGPGPVPRGFNAFDDPDEDEYAEEDEDEA
jgi:uncharacterized protein (TIGR02996 family)